MDNLLFFSAITDILILSLNFVMDIVNTAIKSTVIIPVKPVVTNGLESKYVEIKVI